ncbi:ribonuclease H2, subunit B [Neurospora intermedia]|uniref:Ribonuclease H2 subunit B n=1 Tax=Neurospora intermedia TaxID=5142 RepID=A0ABR3DC35_NEUIN
MPRTTRSKASTADSQDAKSSFTSSKTKSKSTTTSSNSSIYPLAPQVESPPSIFVLPKSATPQSRIITLQNPRYAKPTRYLVCPDPGSFYEFTKIAAPQEKSPRSWLIDSAKLEDGTTAITPAQTTKDSEFYVATQIDPLFLVLPALAAADKKQQRMFLSSDDHFDAVSEQDNDGKRQNHLLEVLKWPQARNLLEKRMAAVCDTVEAGDETMFRLNESKLVEELLSKAKRMSEGGLPKSMEEKFVAKALEAPIVGIRTTGVISRSDTTVSTESQEETTLSEATTAVTTPTPTSTAGAGAEVTPSLIPTPEILNLQRLRVSLNFLTSSYLPPSLSSHLKSSLSGPSSVDFSPLDTYLAQLAKLRQEAVASRSHSDFSRKRIAGDEEEAFERAEKRRKKEEEEKAKKAGVSRGVKELAKVNTRGMMKLTSFFQKKT